MTTGPIYAAKAPRLETDAKVQIPEAFYLVVARDAKSPQALAFVVPHEGLPRGQLERYLVSIDAIEARTGLDLFWALDDTQEAALEAKPAASVWPLTPR